MLPFSKLRFGSILFFSLFFFFGPVFSAGCSFFEPTLVRDKHLYFPEDTLFYQEYNLSDKGDMGILLARYPFLAALREEILSSFSQNEPDPQRTRANLAALFNSEFALGLQLGDEHRDFLLHIRTQKKNHLRQVAMEITGKYQEKPDSKTEEVERQGVKIISFKNSAATGDKANLSAFSYALLGKYEALVARDAETIVQAIERSRKSQGALAHNQNFQNDFTKLDTNHLASWFINYGHYRDLIRKREGESGAPKISTLLDHPLIAGKIATTVTVELAPEGLKFVRKESRADSPESLTPAELGADLADFIPQESLFWLHGQNFNALLSLLHQTLVSDPSWAAKLASLEKITKISLTEDIIALFDGEFVFSVMLPASAVNLLTEPVGFSLIVKNSDAAKIQASWEKLEPILVAVLQSLSQQSPLFSPRAAFQDWAAAPDLIARELPLADEKNGLDIAMVYGLLPEKNGFFLSSSRSVATAMLTANAEPEDKSVSASVYRRKLALPQEKTLAFGLNLMPLWEIFGSQILPAESTVIQLYLKKFVHFGGYNAQKEQGEIGYYTLFINPEQ